MISFADFEKLDLRVGQIESAEPVLGASKLFKLSINLGAEKRQTVAGLAEYYTAEELVGKKVIVLTNLEPRIIRGLESQAMLLAAEGEGKVTLLALDRDVPVGSKIR